MKAMNTGASEHLVVIARQILRKVILAGTEEFKGRVQVTRTAMEMRVQCVTHPQSNVLAAEDGLAWYAGGRDV